MRPSMAERHSRFLIAVLLAIPLSVCGVRGPEVTAADPEDDLARKEAEAQKKALYEMDAKLRRNNDDPRSRGEGGQGTGGQACPASHISVSASGYR